MILSNSFAFSIKRRGYKIDNMKDYKSVSENKGMKIIQIDEYNINIMNVNAMRGGWMR